MILPTIKQWLEEASKMVNKAFDGTHEIQEKSSAIDLVTNTDIAISQFFINQIKNTFPDDGIISEEDVTTHQFLENNAWKEGVYWIMDPIDGTSNFATGIPLYGIMLARMEHGELSHSGIALPEFNEYYLAEKGKGATLNGATIHCSKKSTWKESYGCTGSTRNPKKKRINAIIDYAVNQDAFLLTAYGSAAISGCYTATGKRDWHLSVGGMLWDYAPIKLLLEESGCLVTNLEGRPWQPGDREILTAPPELHTSLRRLIDEAL